MPETDYIDPDKPKPKTRKPASQGGVEPSLEVKKPRARKPASQEGVEPAPTPKPRTRKTASEAAEEPAPDPAKKPRTRKPASQALEEPAPAPVKRTQTRKPVRQVSRESVPDQQIASETTEPTPEPIKKTRARKPAEQQASAEPALVQQTLEGSVVPDPEQKKPRERRQARKTAAEPLPSQRTYQEGAMPLIDPRKLEARRQARQEGVEPAHRQIDPDAYFNASFGGDFDDIFDDDDNSLEEVVTRVKVRRRKRRIPRWAFITVLVALSILVVGGTAFGVNYLLGSLHLHGNPNENLLDYEGAINTNSGMTIQYNGHTYVFNESIVSVAFMGFDRQTVSEFDPTRKGQADSIMVIAIDTKTGKTTVIAVPRDTMTEVNTYNNAGDYLGTRSMQICLAYSYGDGREKSCENVLTTIPRVMYGMPINYYFALDESGIGVLNDTIGGVSLTALETIPGTNIIKGQETLLMGNNAFKYVQFRNMTDLEASLARQDRQIQYIQAFTTKTLSLVNGEVGALVNLYNVVQDHSVTNLSISEITYLATTVVTNGVSSVKTTSLPGEMVQGEKYAEYYLDKDKVFEIVLEVYYTKID